MFNPNKITSAQRKRLFEERKRIKEASDREKAMFQNCIGNVKDKAVIEDLNKLIKTIEREGERLAHFRSMSQLDHYKKKVREFVEKANRKTFKVKATGFVDASGDYSTQLIVEKIDGALENLTKFIINKESQPFEILEKLDLIKGMLTDLYQ